VADPFVAEVRIFPFNFAPKGWAFCDGQLMPLSQNTALFSLLGTMYGGDGKSTFALPNVQGGGVMHPGQGQGLSLRDQGEQGGSESVTLLQSEMPVHNHNLMASGSNASTTNPSSQTSLARSFGGLAYKIDPPGTTATLAPEAIGVTGGNLPHNNMMPYLTLNYCIALQGVFPPRT
jgi:microcystin-dependent protein